MNELITGGDNMINKTDEKKIEKLGSFEISEKMVELAKENTKGNPYLNAGRGNPNWINRKARLAFSRLLEFGIEESERTISDGDLVGYTELDGISNRFISFLNPNNNETDAFLMTCLDYLKNDLSLTLDEVVKEFVDGVLGNLYPSPNRVLNNTEVILNHYLQSVLYNGVDLANDTTLFPTEGGSAAIVYTFQSLRENKLIRPGDKIAINTPIFTPYLQIPVLNDYELVEVDLSSKEENNWEIDADTIQKLNDPELKAFFLVNPSNPGSKALNDTSLAEIKKAVENNPDLMIITDDVYGTFVDDFQTVYSVCPFNTLLVYSYSKLFGATGWRLGVIALNKENVFDKLIANLSDEEHDQLNKRYNLVVMDTQEMSFINRMVADSRSIGLYHIAGLSTPSQIMEALFSLTHLVVKNEEDSYIEASKKLVNERYENLHAALNYQKDESEKNAKYYSMINIYHLAEERYGTDFKNYLMEHYEQIDFLVNLAQKNGIVLMDGVGFGANPGDLRVSEANLPTKDYQQIGLQILDLLNDYYQTFKKNQ